MRPLTFKTENKKNMATNNGDDMKSRDGFASSNNETSGGGEKKKRMRVGDLRKQTYNATAESNSRGENPYKSNDRQSASASSYGSNNRYNQGDRPSRPSYGSNDRYNQGDRPSRPSYGSNDRYNNNDRPRQSSYGNSYSNDREGGYNRDNSRQGGSYNREGGNERRSYNSNNNRGGGYNNNGRSSGGYNSGYRNTGGSQQRGGRPVSGEKRLVKPVKYKENVDPTIPLRLNKYLANAGVCSRREADAYITAGVVKVNGEVVDQLGAKVTRADLVTFHDQPVRLESKVYVLLNKPKNCVTTSDDPQNRMTVMDLVKNACPERIYPVGRLDRNTTGVLLLTNDGDLASKLTHPKFMKKKIYQVTLDRDVAIEDMQAIADGIELDDGEIHADSIAYQAEDVLNVVGIEIHSGRNRVVRRIFEKLGYQVVKLDRVYFAGLTKKNVLRGKWRYLSETEVNMLRMGAFE